MSSANYCGNRFVMSRIHSFSFISININRISKIILNNQITKQHWEEMTGRTIRSEKYLSVGGQKKNCCKRAKHAHKNKKRQKDKCMKK